MCAVFIVVPLYSLHVYVSLIIILVRLFVCLFVQTITRAFVRLGASDSTRALLGVAGRSSSLSLAVCARPAKIRSLLRRKCLSMGRHFVRPRSALQLRRSLAHGSRPEDGLLLVQWKLVSSIVPLLEFLVSSSGARGPWTSAYLLLQNSLSSSNGAARSSECAELESPPLYRPNNSK